MWRVFVFSKKKKRKENKESAAGGRGQRRGGGSPLNQTQRARGGNPHSCPRGGGRSMSRGKPLEKGDGRGIQNRGPTFIQAALIRTPPAKGSLGQLRNLRQGKTCIIKKGTWREKKKPSGRN